MKYRILTALSIDYTESYIIEMANPERDGFIVWQRYIERDRTLEYYVTLQDAIDVVNNLKRTEAFLSKVVWEG